MSQFNVHRNWWMVIAVTAAVGIAVILITEQLLPDYKNVGVFLAFGLLGAAFCWVYANNKERLWWAIIPGLGLFTLLAAVLAAALQTKDENESSWLGVLVLGIGAAIIGAVLKRADAKFILFAVAMIIFVTAVAMIPISWILRGVLIAMVVLGSGFYLWRISRKMGKSG
jgi:peptidoglycan/LPS O-acetylase OafA/YrhL